MSILALILLALAMSVDAFTVALAKGATMRHTTLPKALQAGVVFGVVEMITPVIGWGIGRLAADYVSGIDHWIAFGLLFGLGLHFLYNAFFEGKTDEPVANTNNTNANVNAGMNAHAQANIADVTTNSDTNTSNITKTTAKTTDTAKQPLLLLVITAFATSIDAMAMGVSLAFLQVNIWLAAVLIGLATTVMATLGIFLGHKLNERIGKWAEIIGALALMCIGVWILNSHVGFLAV